MGLYVTGISQSRAKASIRMLHIQNLGYMGLDVTAISQSRGKNGPCHYAYTKFKIFVLAIFDL